jgi:hypothetical protein
MARIRTRRRADTIRVVFAGPLTARDMGRLERACADALTRQPLRLYLDLSGVTAMDRTASAIVDRLQARGATVTGRPQVGDPARRSGMPAGLSRRGSR